MQGIYEAVIKIYPYSSDRTQKLGTEMITGNGPDLIQQTLFDISEYVSGGMIMTCVIILMLRIN